MIEAIGGIEVGGPVAFGHVYRGPLFISTNDNPSAPKSHSFAYTFPEPFDDTEYEVAECHVFSRPFGSGWNKPDPSNDEGMTLAIDKGTAGVTLTLTTTKYTYGDAYFLAVICAYRNGGRST